MASSAINISANAQEVINLRKRIDELKAALSSMRRSTDPAAYDKLNRELQTSSIRYNRLVGDIQRYVVAQQQAERATSKSSDSLTDLLKKGVALAGITFGADRIWDLGKAIVRVHGEMQQLNIAFSTMLKSQEKADALMSGLKTFATDTPFGLMDSAKGAKQLLAYGTTAENIIGDLKMLGNVASGVSAPLGDIVYLYGTLRSQGRAYAVDIRQFAGRGIPIYAELAKVLKVNVDQVNELVSAGKVGFPEVEQAFKNMTSGGGMFEGLMEKQTASVTGQIEKLKDNIQFMFDAIGTSSEGAIYGAIDGASTLVENYETVGKVLLGLIATYGAYKTAVILLSTVENIRYQSTLAQMAGYSRLAVITELLTAKTAALNKVLMNNAYAILAAAAVALAYGIYQAVTATSKLEDSQKRVNDITESFNASIENERLKLDILFERFKNAKKGTDEYKKAKDDIMSQAESYQTGLSKEIDLLNDVAGAYKAISAAALQSAKDRAIAKGTQSAIDAYTEEWGKSTSKIQKEFISKFGKEQGSLLLDSLKDSLSNGKELSKEVESAIKSFDRIIYSAQGAAATTQSYQYNPINLAIGNIRDSKKVLDQEREELIGMFGSGSSSGKKEEPTIISTYNDQLKSAQDNVSKLEKDLASLRKGIRPVDIKADVQFDFSKNIEEKAKELKDAQDKLSYLTTGQSYSASNKANNAAETAAEKARKLAQDQADLRKKLANEALQAELDYEQAILDAKEDSYDKQFQLNDLNYKKELQKIKEYNDQKLKEQADFIEKYGKKAELPEELTDKSIKDQVARKTTQAQSDYKNSDYKTEKQRLEADKQSWNEYLKSFGDYEDKRLAIIEEYREKISKAQTQGEKALLAGNRDKELQDLRKSMLDKSDLFVRLFSDSEDHTAKYIEDTIKQTQQLIDYLNGVEGVQIPVGLDEKDIEYLKSTEGAEKLKDIFNALKKQKEDLNTKNPFKNLIQGFDDLKKAGKDSEKRSSAINGIGKSLSEIVTYADAASDAISRLSDLGIFSKKDADNVKNIVGYLEGSVTASAGLGKVLNGDMSGIKDMISGTMSMVESAIGLFGSGKTLTQKQIDAYKDLLSVLDDVIARQKELLQNSSAKESSKYYQDALDTIEKQREAAKRFLTDDFFESKQNKTGRTYGARERRYIQQDDNQAKLKALGIELKNQYDLLNLTKKEIELIQDKMPEFYANLFDETKDYLQLIVDTEDQTKKLGEALQEVLTGISFDSLKDSLDDLVQDVDTTFSDIGDSFEDHMRNAVLNFVKSSYLTATLQDWYDKFAEYAKPDSGSEGFGLTPEETAELRKMYEDAYNKAQGLYDSALGVIDVGKGSSSSSQKASSGYSTSMSQDTGEAIEGRMTAMQMNLISIDGNVARIAEWAQPFDMKYNVDVLTAPLSALSESCQRIELMMEENRNIALQTFYVVKDIKVDTSNLSEINEKLGRIESNTKAFKGK